MTGNPNQSANVAYLAWVLDGANAKTAQAAWKTAEQLGIGDQVRRAWLDKLAERPVDKP